MLGTEILGIKFKNPVFLASGIMGETGSSLVRMAKEGAGAVTTKSIGLKPNPGHKNPTIVVLEDSLLNAMGLPNPGVDEYIEELREAKKRIEKMGVRIIGSIYGKDEDEFREVAKKIEDYVDIIELNISCPHAKGYGATIGQDPELSYKVCKAVKEEVKVPVFAKLTPNVSNILEIAEALVDAKVDGFVAINTVRGMKIDIKAKRPILSNKFGGLSGKAIKPIGVKIVYDLYENFDKPIIGVGGIFTGEDAIEYMMAGASAVQVGSAVYFRGYDVFKKICDEIKEFLIEENLKLKEIVGIAHE
ncbi:dihydroorotate dehydrogenase family protein [Methanocaldococcus infernus ME]|uniref:Dihydroorotate dehydrogenase n=1 Tax=Methanocaldococcus infernus (strain DSM 11812 / JCM 15783 / ME) TaxID=573063 RepID=D5VQZ7_METIM|nr:dihydroorotate dehydrogenase [Methanocaldococcus infernus]ADG13000.1 dihydroorotate dehydrogenase family protein [Methanocaldococcus infernus ME]